MNTTAENMDIHNTSLGGVIDAGNCSLENCSLENSTLITNRYKSHVGVLGVQCFISVLVVLANSMIIAAIRRMGNLVLPNHIWIAHLDVADVCVGVMFILRFVLNIIAPDNEPLCRTIFIFLTASLGSSSTGLLAMSIRTYIDVKSTTPFNPLSGATQKTIRQVIGVWLGWIVIGVIGRVIQYEETEILSGCQSTNGMFHKVFVFSLCVMIFLHSVCIGVFQFGTLRIVKSHVDNMAEKGLLSKQKRIDTTTVTIKSNGNIPNHVPTVSASVPDTGTITMNASTANLVESNQSLTSLGSSIDIDMSNPTNPSADRDNRQRDYRKTKSKKRRRQGRRSPSATKTKSALDAWRARVMHLGKLASIVTLLFTVCWIPFGIVATINALLFPLSDTIVLSAATLMGLNSLMNVFVLAIKGDDFRSQFKQMLQMCQCCQK